MTTTETTLKDLPQTQRKRRGHDFWPPKADAKKIPALYSTEGVALEDKVVHLHYFGGSADFYITEVDPATGMAFGYVDLGHGGEWGEVFLPEVEEVNAGLFIIERDKWFTPRPFKEVRR